MGAPETLADLAWWLLSGSIFVCVAACAMLLNLLLKRRDTICVKMEQFQEIASSQERAIVEIQTRCAFHHGTPVQNSVIAQH